MSSTGSAGTFFDAKRLAVRTAAKRQSLAGRSRDAGRVAAAASCAGRAIGVRRQSRHSRPAQIRHGRELLAVPPLPRRGSRHRHRLAPIGEVAASLRARTRMGSGTVGVVLARRFAWHALQIGRGDEARTRQRARARAGLSAGARRRARSAVGRRACAGKFARGAEENGPRTRRRRAQGRSASAGCAACAQCAIRLAERFSQPHRRSRKRDAPPDPIGLKRTPGAYRRSGGRGFPL